jgi:hypothetical protein
MGEAELADYGAGRSRLGFFGRMGKDPISWISDDWVQSGAWTPFVFSFGSALLLWTLLVVGGRSDLSDCEGAPPCFHGFGHVSVVFIRVAGPYHS